MVALKVLKRNVFESRQVVLAEARAAAALNSPNVCTIYAVDEEDGLPVIAMEYLDGVSLSRAIAAGLDRPTALRLARQIAGGLATAHEQGVVHGDLKPANVIVSSGGVAKIVDFGLSSASVRAGRGGYVDRVTVDKVEAGAETERFDATVDFVAPGPKSTIRGTPAYMSPEQARAEPATAASDVYAFGLVFYEMLTGRAAIPERSILETLLLLQSADLGPELALEVEGPYQELLQGMLARDAGRRPGMGEVAERLAEMGGL
ncbi:MAG: serine/threonine-protein kinase [Thermoguttaceae bacterium]